ncbi:acyl-CoA synthetase [Methylobacterium oryzihabitans]|uniref:AMP-dependent synthetase n=1 Tax=Methylobacterium oryzihabitans TaxID=2499852 RepID=A0A3S3U7Z9_9HYPH|nr:acyl-CoA synthetase [Methylobacterium oryzihabitans]RVU17725.1 AMP-dependent synthetase [Methylobacterium oryzihabitans]
MLHRAETYEDLVAGFRWRIPAYYNIGTDVCDRHAPGNPLALIHLDETGRAHRYGFDDIRLASNRFANVLAAHGLVRGDRLAVLLPQAPETAIAHVTGFRAGLITIPLFTLFGPDALAYRLGNSGARAVVTDRGGAAILATLRDRLPELERVYCIDGPGEGAEDFHALCARASDAFAPLDTAADDPAVIIYTSGTTGDPKGALHAHRVLLGHLPGVELPQDFFPQPGDRFWTPADWAWIGGLFDVLLPSWHHGVPVVAHRARKFDPEAAFRLMAEHEVRNVFLPPTALKLMRQVRNERPPGLALRSVGSGGESLGQEILAWGEAVLGLTINEFYGQTECNLVASSCAGLFPVRPGAIGRAVPGHQLRIVDGEGREVPDGTPGQIGIRRPDPVMFLGYWRNAAATEKKFAGEFLLTGDLGRREPDGTLWFVGRDDDVITSGGYRIGPGEIEDCLLRHPAVAMAGVVGVPDPVRTEIVKAFIVLKDGVAPSDALAREVQDFVKTRLAAHEYPRRVAFVDALPMTATGKIVRGALREIPDEAEAG